MCMGVQRRRPGALFVIGMLCISLANLSRRFFPLEARLPRHVADVLYIGILLTGVACLMVNLFRQCRSCNS